MYLLDDVVSSTELVRRSGSVLLNFGTGQLQVVCECIRLCIRLTTLEGDSFQTAVAFTKSTSSFKMNFCFFLALFAQIVAIVSAATCDTNKKENKCMAASSDLGKCSWCSSGAVGAACYEEGDAKALPSSIFECEYQKSALRATTCDGLKESTCMKTSAGSDKCSWCNSAAVGGTCFTESDAKSLPSSVFQCEYQKSLKLQKATTCDGVTSEKTCMTSTFDGNKCSWCTSGAVGATCFNEADAKTLPTSVFECEYQKATYTSLRAN